MTFFISVSLPSICAFLPDPGIEPGSPALEADALTSEPPGKPHMHTHMHTDSYKAGLIRLPCCSCSLDSVFPGFICMAISVKTRVPPDSCTCCYMGNKCCNIFLVRSACFFLSKALVLNLIVRWFSFYMFIISCFLNSVALKS